MVAYNIGLVCLGTNYHGSDIKVFKTKLTEAMKNVDIVVAPELAFSQRKNPYVLPKNDKDDIVYSLANSSRDS